MRSRNTKKKKISKIFLKRIILTILLLIIVYNLLYFVSNVFNAKWSFFGIKFFVVDSNAMKPLLNQKDLIITKKIQTKNVKQNDIIVYVRDESYRITRIINIHENKGNLSYAIKGDNHYYAEEILSDTVQGKLVGKIFMGGIFINILRSKVLTVIICICIILIYRRKRTIRLKKERRKKLKTKM